MTSLQVSRRLRGVPPVFSGSAFHVYEARSEVAIFATNADLS